MSEDPLAGEIVKAMPEAAWEKLIATTCETFTQVVAPITATTSGIGRWITARFERMEGVEKVNTVAILAKARQVILDQHQAATSEPAEVKQLDFKVIANAVEQSSRETNEDLQTLWANLIASEFTRGGVHPLFPDILSKLTAADAKRLVEIAASYESATYFLMKSFSRPPRRSSWMFQQKPLITESALEALGLIERDSKEAPYEMTELGEAFIKAVRSPESKPSPEQAP